MQTAQPALPAAPDRLRVASWLNHRPLWGYGILAYGISWILLLGAVAAIQFDFFSSDSPVLGLINQIAVFGPALAAWVVIAITQGRAEVGPWLRSLVQWRVGIQWYLFVVFGIPLIMLIGESVIHGMRPFQALAQQWPMLFTRYLPYVVLTTLATGLAEEPGWRGFALPRFQAKHGPLVGIFISGLVWSFWHLPNLLFQPGCGR